MKYTSHEIKVKVQTNSKWAEKAIVALYKFQTSEEQYLRETVFHNKVGFNGVDAEILSSFAQQIVAGRTLSHKQLSIAFRKLGKYAKQLERIATAKEELGQI